MSDLVKVCDAVLNDLTGPDRPCEGFVTHRLAPWDPEELVPDEKQHVAVWPIGEQVERTEESEFVTGGHTLVQGYYILVWEMAKEEEARLKLDEKKAEEWLDLHNAIRARIYTEGFQTLGGSNPLWYTGVSLPEQVGPVRWMRIGLVARKPISFS